MKQRSSRDAPLDLLSVQAFVQVAECRSFNRVARESGVSTSSVARRIQSLEQRLGALLLERTSRRVELTEAGERFLSRCTKLLSDAREAALEVAELGQNPKGLLRVTAPSDLGALHIVHIAAGVMARHRELRLHLSLSDSALDLVADRFDVAIRVARQAPSTLRARRLAASRRIICGAPSYFDRRGTPREADELPAHDLLSLTTLSASRQWGMESDRPPRIRGQRASFDTSLALREAVLAGMGLARIPEFLVADALRSGQLREVLSAIEHDELVVFAIYRPSARVPPKVRVLIDALNAELPRRLKGLE